MPRSKNPNPRQVTDDEVNGNPEDESQANDSKSEINGDMLMFPENIGAQTEECADLPSSHLTGDWALSVVEPSQDGDADAYFTAPSAISALQFTSMPSNHSEENLVSQEPDTSCKQVEIYARSSEVKKAKTQSTNVLNPQVMIWMRNRFEMGSGGKISASDISNLYRTDTEHMEHPPPGLQNYQVGQLLRRVFPEITRCKITVNGRRYWVYKHLTLIKNPPENLFEEQPIKALDLGGFENTAHRSDEIGTNGSPPSTFHDAYADGEDADNEVSKLDLLDTKFADDKEKSNAILLGLLGTDRPTTSPTEDTSSFQNGVGMGKKKRDSEVIDWLRTSYKYKPGYYVKSMDLLRKYNNGRVEIVKYLSQVGRVMKHVFPAVRHLRKSFKGGKREWVYLNLKPVDVDSDSEEGQKMVMPTMRRATGWYQGLESSSFDVPKNSTGWKRERVDISHAPLSLVQADSVFNRCEEVFQAKRYPNDNKVIITKKSYDDVPSLLQWAKHHGFANETENAESASPEDETVKGPKSRNFVASSDIDKIGESSDIERDIFAAFTRVETNNDSDYQMPAKRVKLAGPHSSKTSSDSLMASSNSSADTKPSYMPPLHPAILELPPKSTSPVLDLSVKGSVNGKSSFREKIDQILGAPDSPMNVPAVDCQDVAYTSNHPIGYAVNSTPSISAARGSHPTIHYRPQSMSRNANYTHNRPESSKSPSANLQYLGASTNHEDSQISWHSIQNFDARCYGWMKSQAQPHQGETKDGKQPRFVEWFLFCGQLLVNKQRALKEIKIYDDWTVEIHALGRRVYPNDLGGITDLEKTTSSLNKVFRVLSTAKMCTGFSAPSVNDLYIHGILVSRFEVWSSREDSSEDLRQRAVNCQMMHSGPNACCSKCSRIMKLYHQQHKSSLPGKRNSQDITNFDERVKLERM